MHKTSWQFRLACTICSNHKRAPKKMNFSDTITKACHKCKVINKHCIKLMRFNRLVFWWKPWTWLRGEWILWGWKN